MSSRLIPSALGLLSLSLTGAGCSDAAKVANTLEKVCKADCDCPDTLSVWNDVSNCKRACEGYGITLEAVIEDEATDEPCAELGQILSDMRGCTDQVCGALRSDCLDRSYYELFTCWELFGSYYNNLEPSSGPELVEQLRSPIPGAIDPAVLHAARLSPG